MANKGIMGIGGLLILAGVTPTPDDITVISPIIQIVLGLALVGVGYVMKK